MVKGQVRTRRIETEIKLNDSAGADNDKADEEYVLPESDSRYYTAEELARLSPAQLRLARNEIYARHGLIFQTPDLKKHFEGTSWYDPSITSDQIDENTLNDIEKE
ncbi:MAG: YARHG domain-containing protein, partial [Parasporobacterium sp.]|nr:YARHG domain-containing protein [Parasporobacterium sp.]